MTDNTVLCGAGETFARALIPTFLQELASHAPLENDEYERIIAQEMSRKRKKRAPLKPAEEQIAEEQKPLKPARKRGTRKAIKPELPAETLAEESRQVSEKAEPTVTAPVESEEKTEIRRRGEVLTKVCSVEVCQPEICCADVEGEFPSSTTT